MTNFTVEVKETLIKNIEVTAESMEDAIAQVEAGYKKSE